MPSEKRDVDRQAEDEQGGQHSHVQAVKPRDGLVTVIRTSDEDFLQIRPGDWRPP